MFTGDPYSQETTGVLEKIAIQTQLYMALDLIQEKLGVLAKNQRQWTRRDLWDYASYIDDLVEALLHRTAGLARPRHVPIEAMIEKGPEAPDLGPDGGVTYATWRPYILAWLDIIEQALDRAGLLVTDVAADMPWSMDFIEEVLEKTRADVSMKENDEEEDTKAVRAVERGQTEKEGIEGGSIVW